MHGHGRIVECLIIGVAKHECDIVDAFTIHVVDSIATTAAYTNHFDDAVFLLRCSEVQDLYVISVLFHIILSI